MAAPILSLREVAVGFGGRALFADLSLGIAPGARLCLVGRNGSGKSTLLKMLAGLIEPDAGERFVQPGMRIAYLVQEPDLGGFSTVAAYVAAATTPGLAEHVVAAALERVGIAAGRDPKRVSGGEARRAQLARALALDPDVLLLDEPTNHLDLPTIEWLERELEGHRAAQVVVSHDRAFLARVSHAILWLDRGMLRRHEQSFAAFEDWSDAVIAEEARARARRDKLIEEETAWSRAGISARRRRNQGRLRRLHALREERSQELAEIGRAAVRAKGGPRSGRIVIEAEGVGYAYDGAATEAADVIDDFNIRILRGDRLGVIGPNGAGKTTLLNLLTGRLAPTRGQVRLGVNLEMEYLDQTAADLDPGKSLRATLCPGGGDQVIVGGRARHVAGYLRDFLFDPRQLDGPVAQLSGGELSRLRLARALSRRCNFLVLDEPTNDLDVETLDLLQETLGDFVGTVLLVSHDRDFLDRVVTSTVAMTGDGRAIEYAGGYSDYLRQRRPEPTRPAVAPKEAPAPVSAPARRRQPPRLGYREKRLLAALPEQIAALTAEIATIESALSDPTLYARDPERFAGCAARLSEARAELASAEERWLELELQRAQADGD